MPRGESPLLRGTATEREGGWLPGWGHEFGGGYFYSPRSGVVYSGESLPHRSLLPGALLEGAGMGRPMSRLGGCGPCDGGEGGGQLLLRLLTPTPRRGAHSDRLDRFPLGGCVGTWG